MVYFLRSYSGVSVSFSAMLASCALVAGADVASAQTITISQPGGLIQEAGDAALWGPAAKKLGYSIRLETSQEPIVQMRMEAASNSPQTDIFITETYVAEIAGAEGLLAPIDYAVVSNRSEFMDGTATDYCVGTYSYTTGLGWNAKVFGDNAPNTPQAFWDVEKYPGRRGVRAIGLANLELALLADGVPAAEVYDVLGTEEGYKRAFDKMAALKPHISVFWTSGAQHVQLMSDEEVVLSTGYNGRFQFLKDEGKPIDYTFDNSILTVACFAVAANSKHKEEAMKLLAEMSTAESQAGTTKFHTYGPLNLKAYDSGIIDPKVAEILPTNPKYAPNIIVQDARWYATHYDRLIEDFQDLMGQ